MQGRQQAQGNRDESRESGATASAARPADGVADDTGIRFVSDQAGDAVTCPVVGHADARGTHPPLDDTDDLATRSAILQALDLPPEAIPLFLDHIERFCQAHGGEKHYAQLLALVARYRGPASAPATTTP